MIVRFSRLGWRLVLENRRRSLLTIAGAALGVGLMVAILSLAAMARAGVERQIQQEFGGIDLIAGSWAGKVALSDADVASIRAIPGVMELGSAFLPFMGEAFEEERLTRYVGLSEEASLIGLFGLPQPVRPGEVILNHDLAERLQVSTGQSVTLPFPDQNRTYKVVAVIATTLRAGTPYLAYFSLQDLQQATGRQGQITAVYIRLADRSRKENIAYKIGQVLEVQNPDAHRVLMMDLALEADEARRNLGGLRSLGIAAGSMSLLVSVLLVVGMVQFAMRERLQEIALLRAVGAMRAQAVRLLMGEVMLLAGLGALGGGAGGVLLALLSGRLVAGWLGVPAVIAVPSWAEVLVAMMAGWLLQVVASWLPVHLATFIPPVQAARQADTDEARLIGRWWLPVAALSGAALLLGINWFLSPGEGEMLKLLLSVISGTLGVLGIFGLAAGVLSALLWILRPVLALWGRELIIAAQNAQNMQRRGNLATVVLGSAAAVSIVAFTLIQTNSGQQEQAFRGQFPTPLVVASRREMSSTIPWETAREIGALSGVARSAALGVWIGLTWTNHEGFPIDPAFRQFWTQPEQFALPIMPVDMAGLAAMGLVSDQVVGQERAVVISQDMARQTGWKVGDSLRFRTMTGDRYPAITTDRLELRVAAIIPEPLAGARAEDIMIDRGALPLKPDRALLWKVLVESRSGQQETIIEGLNALTNRMPELDWSTEEQARKALKAKVRQSYAVLGASVVVIALLGLLSTVNTLTASLHARRRESAMLRAAGMTAVQFFRLILAENLLFVLGALITGLLAGLSFAYLAVVPLGGWSLAVPWPIVGVQAGISLVVTVVVCSLATRQVARGQVLEILRQE